MKTRERIPLLCALSTSRGYGMQEMTYTTALGLSDEFKPVILAPAGAATDRARELGFEVVETLGLKSNEAGGIASAQSWAFGGQLRPYLARHKRVAFIGTRCMHSLVFASANLLYRRRVANFHVVHGVEEDARWAQKRILDRVPFPISVVAVSEYAKERMQSYGLRKPVRVIENYLTDERLATATRRPPFTQPGVRRAAVVSRLFPSKRLDVLLGALEMRPELNAIEFHVYGDGPEEATLKERAAKSRLNIVFEGFRSDIAGELAKADALVHTGPLEILPLALLEAMAADLPIVAPDSGGAACTVEHGVSGLQFVTNDPASMSATLLGLLDAEPSLLNGLVAGGRAALATRFSEKARLAEYRAMIWETLGKPHGG